MLLTPFPEWASESKELIKSPLFAHEVIQVMSESFFVDWALTKSFAVCDESENISEVEDLTVLPTGSNIYLETGMPRALMYQMVQSKDHSFFIVDAKLVKKQRGKRAKTDVNDALVIKELFDIDSGAFKELRDEDRKEIEIDYLSRMYWHYTQVTVALTNKHKALKRHLGENSEFMENLIKEVNSQKTTLMKKLRLLVNLDPLKHIKGIGVQSNSGVMPTLLLNFAHPKRFSSLSRFLAYCGYKENTFKDTKKYSRKVKYCMYNIVEGMIKAKDPRYYELYQKIRGQLAEKSPEAKPHTLNGKARNRVATFFLKEFYNTFKSS